MIENPITQNMADVYSQAVTICAHKYSNGYRVIKDTFLSAIDADPDMEELQKTATRLAAEKLEQWNGGPLIGILSITWEDIGLSSKKVTALDTAKREAIMAGIMAVCKGIIQAEAQRLADITTLDTALPVGWNEPLAP